MRNQCDGCCAGMPIDSTGHHRNPDSDFYTIHMACQAKLYPRDLRHTFVPNKRYPWFCAHCGYGEHERLIHRSAADADD